MAFFFHINLFLLTILKGLQLFYYKEKRETEPRNFSSLIFNGYNMIYDNVGGIRYLLKQGPALEFCRKPNIVLITSTETHFNHDQIHHM